MRNIVKLAFLLIVLSACSSAVEKQVDKRKIINVPQISGKLKDTVNVKSAIGKSYDKWLHEIPEFSSYDNSGGWSIVEYVDLNSAYEGYGLKTLDIFERNEKEGTGIIVGIKYIVLLDGKTVLDYVDVEEVSRKENIVLYGEGVQFNGNVDIELFAFAPFNEEEEEIITEVYKVYRADKETGMIFEIPTEGVTIIAEYM